MIMLLYSSHCPNCKMIEMMLTKKKIPFTIIDDQETCLKIAEENNIKSMPFAMIDGKIYNMKELQTLVKEA